MMVAKQAFEDGMTKEELFELTNIDPWWLAQMEELHNIEGCAAAAALRDMLWGMRARPGGDCARCKLGIAV